jgi:hypothetical protein
LLPAGLPHDNDTVFCPDPNPGGSCYFYYNQQATYAQAQATCQATHGGYLLSLEAEWEQRLIDRRFTVSWQAAVGTCMVIYCIPGCIHGRCKLPDSSAAALDGAE